MANYASLLFDGKEVLTSETFNTSPSSIIPEWHTSPSSTLAVTHLQKDKEVRFDPIKHPERQEPEAKPFLSPKITKLSRPFLHSITLGL